MGMAGVALNGVPGLVAAAEKPGAGIGLNPLAPRRPQFPGKAKAVIHLFMNGGPSHLDTFDPKPELTRLHGQELPKMLTKQQIWFLPSSFWSVHVGAVLLFAWQF